MRGDSSSRGCTLRPRPPLGPRGPAAPPRGRDRLPAGGRGTLLAPQEQILGHGTPRAREQSGASLKGVFKDRLVTGCGRPCCRTLSLESRSELQVTAPVARPAYPTAHTHSGQRRPGCPGAVRGQAVGAASTGRCRDSGQRTCVRTGGRVSRAGGDGDGLCGCGDGSEGRVRSPRGGRGGVQMPPSPPLSPGWRTEDKRVCQRETQGPLKGLPHAQRAGGPGRVRAGPRAAARVDGPCPRRVTAEHHCGHHAGDGRPGPHSRAQLDRHRTHGDPGDSRVHGLLREHGKTTDGVGHGALHRGTVTSRNVGNRHGLRQK